MASNYGRNFGFRRSDESLLLREGRYKTPVGGSALRLGSAVRVDIDNDPFLEVCGADEVFVKGMTGLLVQEEDHIGSIYGIAPNTMDSYDLGLAKKNKYSQMVSGAGAKVWFRNTGVETRADGRSIGAVTMATLTGLAVGDYLKWDGSKWVETSSTDKWMVVTKVNSDSGLVEATLLF